MGSRTIVRTTCEQCYYQCGALAVVEDGRIIQLKGDRDHPQYAGHLCPKGGAHLSELYSPDRLLHPQKRTSAGWQRVSWDEALDDIADRLHRISEKYGPLSISCASDGGPRQVWNTLMVRAMGSPNVFLNTMSCSSSLQIGDLATYGEWITWDFPPDFVNSKLIMVVGSNPYRHCPPSWHKISKALKNGAQLITVDPRFTESAAKSRIWLCPNPGTDAALALAMGYVIVREGLYDRKFVDEWCFGFDQYVERVNEYSPSRASSITGIAEQQIIETARLFAKAKPACMHIRDGIAQQPNGTQTTRAFAVLLALTGNLDIPGGNRFVTSFKQGQGVIDQFKIHRMPDFRLPREIEEQTVGASEFPLYSGADSPILAAHGSLLFKAMMTGNPYPIRAMIVMGSNLVVTHPNAEEVHAALESLDLLVVAERFMTPTAQLAHYVLPVSDFYERDEVCDLCYQDFVSVRQKAVAPAGECWDDREISFALAKRLDVRGALRYAHLFPWRTIEEFNNYRIGQAGITWKDLKAQGIVKFEPQYRQYESRGRFNTPTGKVELYSTFLAKSGFDPLPAYQEIKVRTTELASQYPLILISGARHWAYKNSEMKSSKWARRVLPHPQVEIHPQTAAELGIKKGDWVWIKTPFGSPVKQRAVLVSHMHPRAIAAQDGWWFPERENGGWRDSNINMVTTTELEWHDPISGMQFLKGLPCAVAKVEDAENGETDGAHIEEDERTAVAVSAT